MRVPSARSSGLGGWSLSGLASLVVACVAGCAPAQDDVTDPEDRAEAEHAVSASSFLDKVTAGYQGWFTAEGDGSPIGGFTHWAAGVSPAPKQIKFDVYPDTREYDDADLHATSLGALGDGRPAELFGSYSSHVVDTHFRWMEESGIDGVGLQRFVAELGDPRFSAHRNHVTENVRAGAEAHGRVFYIEYDISGANEATLVEDLQRDWANVLVGELGVTDSPRYVRQDGRPVVLLWGFGFSDRPGTPAQALATIRWFQEQGCYVGVGVPYEWRTEKGSSKPGFLPAYAEADLLQPWGVGAVSTDADVEHHKNTIVRDDKTWTDGRQIAYQRVIFPGFSWANWNGGAPNMIPRRAGAFFWKQALAVREAGVGAFIAMFDEYDEGTAIAKAAEDSSMAPTSQWFLTLDADGTRVSSDFYLRLAGAATKLIRGEIAPSAGVPIAAYPEGAGSPGGGGAALDLVPPQVADGTTSGVYGAAASDVIVDRLYRAVLGRAADDAGLAAYGPMIEAGSLGQVVTALVLSTEFEARRATLTVGALTAALYVEILGRAPDPSGAATTDDAIRSGHAATRAVQMILSAEYAAANPS